LTTNQPIITSKGYINIENISLGDMAYTHMGRYKKVINTSIESYEGNIYSIRVNGFQEVLRITEDTLVYVCTKRRNVNPDDNLEWIPAKKLHEGDTVIHNLGTLSEDPNDISLAEFICNFLLFGIVDRKGRITLNTENNTEVEKSMLHCADMLDLKFDDYLFNNIKYLSTDDKTYINLCKNLGPRGIRIIPEEIINSSPEFLKEFIKPLIYGNKNKIANMYFRAASSVNLFMGFQRILLKLNCFSNLYKCNSRSKDFTYLALTMNQAELERLGKMNPDAWFRNNNKIFLKVDEILIEPYIGTICSIEVEDDNSYCNHLITIR
jgi:hypothetical protein